MTIEFSLERTHANASLFFNSRAFNTGLAVADDLETAIAVSELAKVFMGEYHCQTIQRISTQHRDRYLIHLRAHQHKQGAKHKMLEGQSYFGWELARETMATLKDSSLGLALNKSLER